MAKLEKVYEGKFFFWLWRKCGEGEKTREDEEMERKKFVCLDYNQRWIINLEFSLSLLRFLFLSLNQRYIPLPNFSSKAHSVPPPQHVKSCKWYFFPLFPPSNSISTSPRFHLFNHTFYSLEKPQVKLVKLAKIDSRKPKGRHTNQSKTQFRKLQSRQERPSRKILNFRKHTHLVREKTFITPLLISSPNQDWEEK